MSSILDVLLVESDPATRDELLACIPPKWSSRWVEDPSGAEQILDRDVVKVLLCSDDLPGETGLMFLARTKARWPKLRRILLAPDLDGELFFHAMREVSLFDYLTKPAVPAELTTALARARAQFEAAERLVKTVPDPLLPTMPPAAKDSAPWPREGALVVAAFAAGCAITLLALALLYLVKTQAGFDLFPLFHLKDLFQ